MKKLIRKVAKSLGCKTSYHVCAKQYHGNGATTVISMTLTVKPWMHVDNYGEVVDYVRNNSNNPGIPVSIVSITKLGL